MSCDARRNPPRPRFDGCADRTSPKPIRCQRARAAVVGPLGLDDGTALVAGRSEELLEERLGDSVGVVLRVDDQEVDGADVAAGSDGRPEGEDRATDDDRCDSATTMLACGR